jgi:3-oxoacyl-[acyl-carrier-protein] synthase III
MTTGNGPRNVIIRGTGKALPPNRFTTEEVWAWHQKKDPAWLRDRFGIDTRHTRFNYRTGELDDFDEDDLSHEAAVAALTDAGVHIEEVQAIIQTSITPSHPGLPDPACVLHRRLGAGSNTAALMVMSACAGTLNGLMLASALVRAGQAKHVLVCASSTYSSFNRRELIDRNWMHTVIFGDAAAAVVVSASDEDRGFSGFHMGADNHNDIGVKKFGGSKHIPGREDLGEALLDFHDLDLRKVPHNLHTKFTAIYERVLEQEGVRPEELDWVLFNMSNNPAQRGWLRAMGIPESRSYFNIERYGNCIAASLGLVLDDFLHSGQPQPGQLGLVMSIGSGLQFGGALYRF